MKHDSAFNKKLRKEMTARALMNEKNTMVKADIDKNIEEIEETPREINKIKKAIYKRRQKNQEHRELSSRLNELTISKTVIRNKIDALEQIILHVEEVKEQVKLKINDLGEENQKHSWRNPVWLYRIPWKTKRR